MNEVQNFDFEGNEVRTIQKDSMTWFAANDVTNTLGLTNTTVAVSRLDDDEVTKFNLGSLSGETNFISEAGLYKLIGSSRKAEHDKKIRDQARKETLAEQRTRTKTRGGQRTIEWSE